MTHYKEGMVELLDVLTQLLSVLGNVGLCYFGYLILKLVVTILICKYPNLSNEKVKYMALNEGLMYMRDKHEVLKI